jgi:ATP-dependent DNA helicase RecQ
MQQISSDHYHAGLGSEERTRKQDDWIQDKTRVIVCTNAFGMGIDKPGVRSVVHADLPDCLENYYQEAGRAGRDGKRSYAVLVLEEKDTEDLKNLSSTKFPGLADIRNIYKSICNYLQVPAGGGDNEYFDFDIPDFLKKFKLSAPAVVNVLHVLEQEGWLSFTEQLFIPSTIAFTCSKQSLYDFESHEPELEPLIKTLLRSYEGIFDQPVTVSEKFIAGITRLDIADLTNKLFALDRAGIIEYSPQKDKPQVMFIRPRIRAEDLNIDMIAYQQRKLAFEKRVAAMVGFVTNHTACRSKMIGNYFGDKDLLDCGICDNCLRQKQTAVSKNEFELMREQVLVSLQQQPLHIKELKARIKGLEKEKSWSVLEFMQSERLIEMDEAGNVRLVK